MTRILFLSHPEVVIDPAVPVPDWGLSERGRARAQTFANRSAAALAGWRVVSSPERKAVQTARILAARSGAKVDVHPGLAEVDRSATGYVPHARHEALALQLFSVPDQSADGWETAIAAQARILRAFYEVLKATNAVIVGHGGTGTLLWLALSGMPIGRGYDQPHQGCGWRAGGAACRVDSGWQAFEDLAI